MKTIAFFNNKGGVGKTSLVYHLAWMYADLGLSVVAADFDPQANLTNMFVDDHDIEHLWEGTGLASTVYRAFQPLRDGTGDVKQPQLKHISTGVALLPGDLRLSAAEDDFSSQWPACLEGASRAFRVISAFWRMVQKATEDTEADIALIDVGPNLGALNRAAMVAADHVVIPLAPDLYSLQGLSNLGPTLRVWRKAWEDRLERKPPDEQLQNLPTGAMAPVGYVVLQHAVRLDRPVKAYDQWMQRIPNRYRKDILDEQNDSAITIDTDPYCLTTLKHYRSLMPLAQEARKPMFMLKTADGVTGGHVEAVRGCYHDFRNLAVRIATECDFPLDPALGNLQ